MSYISSLETTVPPLHTLALRSHITFFRFLCNLTIKFVKSYHCVHLSLLVGSLPFTGHCDSKLGLVKAEYSLVYSSLV